MDVNVAEAKSNLSASHDKENDDVSVAVLTCVVPSQDTIINSPPSLVNSWYSYYTIAGGGWGAVAQPSVTTGTLYLFYNGATTGRTGVYQQLSGLTIGQSYEVTVNLTAAAGGTVRIETYAGTLLQTTYSTSSNTTQVTTSFVAVSVNDIVLIEYEGTSAVLYINSISVRESSPPPTSEYEGQVICDLYEDEDIPITLSVDNFKNVAEKVQSYSKSFNLPATKRNNQIFTNLFEVTMVQDVFSFNPYIKTPCLLKQDGYILFDGYLRLIDIQDKEAEISYNVNLYSEVIALADILQNKTFADLDFTELAHDYNKTEITYSWNTSGTGITYLNSGTSGFRDANSTVKYPFVDWGHQILISDGILGVSGYPQLTTLEQAFRPFINIKYLINRIFSQVDVPFSWTSTFFDSTDFEKLYMDFNWGSGNAPVVFDSYGELTNWVDYNIPTSFTTIDFDLQPDATGTIVPLSANFGYSAGVFTAQADGQVYTFTFNMEFNQAFSVDTLSVEWVVNGVVVQPESSTSTSFFYDGNFTTPPLTAGDTVLCRAKSPANLYDLDGVYNVFSPASTPSLIQITTSVNQTTNDTLLGTLRGEINKWDFLKGIMTMFNIVSMPDEDNPSNINFEPYGDIFINNANSTQLDWTDKIDISEMKLTPLGDLNKKTIFKFADDDDDYAFNVYKKSVDGHLYGSKVYDASGLTLLEGEEEIVAEPFAATIPKPLFSQFGNFITPAIFAANEDATEFEGFDNAPRIMYNDGIKDTGITYYIPEQNGVGDEDEPDFLQFSHLTLVNPTQTPPPITYATDFHFGECQLINPVGSPVADNLFNLYWLPYYSELYNPNTRIMSLKVNLNPSDINTFKFYDTVFIKNRPFRVNNINYKPNDLATVEFILIP